MMQNEEGNQQYSKKEFTTGSGEEGKYSGEYVVVQFPLVKMRLHIKVLLDYIFFKIKTGCTALADSCQCMAKTTTIL